MDSAATARSSPRLGSLDFAIGLHPSRMLARGDRGTGDLALLAVLLLLTAAFGRPFSKLGIPSMHLYVTEAVIAAIAALSVWRCGFLGVAARIRALPLLPLLLLWVAGAVALARGLNDYGLSMVTHDVGLVEYSIFLPIVAIAADTRGKLTALIAVLLVSGLASTVVFGLVYFLAPHGPIGLDVNPVSAVGLYMALFAVLFASRVVHGLVHRRIEWAAAAVAAAGLVLMIVVLARSIMLALAIAGAVLVGLAPSRRRLPAVLAAVLGLAFAAGSAFALQSLGIGSITTVRTTTGPPAIVPFAADDALRAFVGGRVVRGDAAVGMFSREIQLQGGPPYFETGALGGLRKGRKYTVSFWVKPSAARRTSGRVGDTSGHGWGQRTWVVGARGRWQRVVETLVATKSAERLVIYVDSGAARVTVDDLRVVPRGLNPESVAAVESSGTAGPTKPEERTGLVAAISDTFGGNDTGSGFYSNQSWRLAFWGYMLGETVRQPLTGVGFGRPAAFSWNGTLFDGRRDLDDPTEVTAPHNSFVNLLYRTGVFGAAAFVWLVAWAAIRTFRRLRTGAPVEERSQLVGLWAAFAFAVVIASFNVALEGPYMSMFFWTILALLMILPTAASRLAPRAEGG